MKKAISKRLDITILKKLDKKPDSDDSFESLRDLIKEYGYQLVDENCRRLKYDKKFIEYEIPKENVKYSQTIIGHKHDLVMDNLNAKITTEGRDYLIDYNNKISTRKYAIFALIISILSML